MEGSVQPSQTAGVSNPKPAPGPKPRLAPKPFSLQTNTTIRSIHAPKSIVDASKTATPQGVKSEDATVPKPAVPAPPLKPTTSVRAPTKEQGEPTKATEAGQAGRDASDGKSDPVPQATPAVEKPKTAPLESDNAIENNRKTSADAATKLEREDESKKDGTSSTESQVLDESGNPAHRWGSTRKRLSMEITSRFEQGGGPPPAPSNIGKQATSAKHDIIRAECTNPEQNQTTSELPEREGEESGPKEDYVGGGSIKRRISLLFDSRPEVTVKREEPEMINGTGGVKARIKNWVMDTVPEKKPQFVPRPRSKSTETSTPAEKTPETRPTEPPTSSSQVADLPSTSLPVHQPTEGEVSGKHKETEATEDGQSLIFSQAADHTDETDSANNALKRDNSKRRSVHFGVVEKDDGGPPVILGPESDSSEEEEEEEGQEKEDAEADVLVSVPVYRRVGLFQKDGSAEAEEAEKLHHLEFEKKRRAEETEEARRTMEEHKRKEEEEGKEREKERQLEMERVRNEKRQRLEREQERVRLEEEEREKERLREEEIERKRMRLEEEEREKERLRQEQLEKQRIALERMRLEEEEKERLRLEEMEKKRMELERMRLEQEEKERLRLEEMEKKRMELERMRLEQEEKERLRLEEMEKKRMALERMRLEEEEKERLRQEEMESRRKELERRLEEEEREKEKLRKEMERQRMELERRLEEEENEKERMRREMERQMELDTIRMEEEERLKENEMERHREEWERARWEEEHREKENIKEEEIERERRIHQLWDRQKEEIEMMEDIPQEERESKRLWMERERQRLRKEEEERVIHESDEHKFESKLREEEINIEKQREEEWENHWVSKVERLKEENEEKNGPSLMWQSRKEEERDKYTRWKEEQGVERGQKEKEDILICFDSGKSSDSHRSPTQEPPEANVEVVYEDFSIKKNLLEVEFDDFSVKPVKSGGGARDEISAVVQDGGQGAAADAPSEEDEEVDVSMFKWEYKAKQQVESADTREPAASQEREEEEEQLIFSTEITSPSTTQEEPKQEEDAHEVKDDPREEAEDNSCTNVKEKGAEVLIDGVPDEQNEAPDQPSETDSPDPESDHHLEISSEDLDTTDFRSETDVAPFPESSTPLLDSSAQKSKADLSKRMSRTRPSRSLRAGLSQGESPDWRISDSSVLSSKQRESDSEDEQPKQKIFSPHPTSQRVPIFPGLSPAALIAQIKRKTGGKVEETLDDNGREEKEAGAAPSPSQLSSSPRTAAHLTGAARVLPPLPGTDEGATACPPWLKELKSKKRLSQYDGEP
ncbi:hypothetical protein fugu_004787 [Takifugu bimaculatus]|uniref:Tankyrase 1-binding protein C-terminal domain-containing protein n=1 Tax=Takifugu bimaculatus TaxID=433685 RepID=A0A4Z2B848_9TELE|nr:hypothetical protein fugu_004787 [Takifugu bimaculatus]